MRFPRRVPEHIKETESFKILHAQTPAHWLIREVSERDYGVDCYIELVSENGELRGYVVSVQLKSVGSIEWTASGGNSPEVWTYSGVSVTTTAYWMGLQVPVFLLVADISARRIYWVNVKAQVRANYGRFLSQRHISFALSRDRELNRETARIRFLVSYFFERSHERFANCLRDLLVHARDYVSLIENHLQLDFFMEVEPSEQAKLEHLYEALQVVTLQLGMTWNQIPLSERFQEDAGMWSTRLGSLHEGSMAAIVRDLEPQFYDTLEQAAQWVTGREGEYWQSHDFILWEMCINLELPRRPGPWH